MGKQWILVTGGAGFIGSHVVVELLAAGFGVVVLDNFENSHPETVGRVNSIGVGTAVFVAGDVRDRRGLTAILRDHKVAAVIHLAGKKAVGESVSDPLLYYDANLNGALSLLASMEDTGVGRLVFSSSATVYGLPESVVITEDAPTGPTNPYGQTKLMIERFIDDLAVASPHTRAISLRYFNPVGAHSSGLIGESPTGMPNNLFPFIAQVAAGDRPAVRVFGNDYPTPDGTGLRDYVHVVDLARGHVAALTSLLGDGVAEGAHMRINLGTGLGHTVLEAIAAFSTACGFEIPFEIASRRPGDVAALVADPSKAASLLDWRAERSLADMCADHWSFVSRTMREGDVRQSGAAGRARQLAVNSDAA